MTDASTLRDRILHEPASPNGEVTLRLAVELPFIPDQPLTLSFKPGEVPREMVVNLVERLGRIALADRTAFEEPMWAFYCQEMAAGAGNFDSPQAQLDWEADFDNRRTFPNPVHATRPEEVWPLVRFRQLIVRRNDDRIEVWLGGTAAWDGEHGIVFRLMTGRR